MTDYIKQVAEAVAHDKATAAFANWLPIAYRKPAGTFSVNNMEVAFVAGAEWQAKQAATVSHPAPGTQAEIDRLKAEAVKREAFIDELVKQRHAELMAVAEAVVISWDDAQVDSPSNIVAKIEQERGE